MLFMFLVLDIVKFEALVNHAPRDNEANILFINLKACCNNKVFSCSIFIYDTK